MSKAVLFIFSSRSFRASDLTVTLLKAPWTARRSNQSALKEINPDYSLEGLMLKLRLQILRLPDTKSQLTGKDPDAGKRWGQEEKGVTKDEMVGWHHTHNGYAFEQTPRDNEGQGSLACCSPWAHKELDTTELNWLTKCTPTKDLWIFCHIILAAYYIM